MDDVFVFPALHILDPMTTTMAQKVEVVFILACIVD